MRFEKFADIYIQIRLATVFIHLTWCTHLVVNMLVGE